MAALEALFFSIYWASTCWGCSPPLSAVNFGDRLQQSLDATRFTTPQTESQADEIGPQLDGLSPHQIFGLAPVFTRKSLDRARRRLAKKLHPDLWHNTKAEARSAREEALKRVNAAYDSLRMLAAD